MDDFAPCEGPPTERRRAGFATRALTIACLALASPIAGSAQGPTASLQSDATASRTTAVLLGESARIELEGRRLVDVALGSGAEISSLATSGDRWLLAGSRLAVDGRRRLAIIVGDDQGWREIAAPLGLRGRARSGAVLLGDPDSLDLRSELTLAWLEGDGSQRQSVFASRFEDGRFLEPELVSAAGPGSQVALRGAVLPDGTPLLVWNAFDGEDNEIVWSWRRAGAWSELQRIGEDNDVPDVSPVLLATEAGAVAAWSRFDGRGYRVVVSRLEGSAWSRPTMLAGSGAMTARLLADREGALLLYQEASPRRWTVARLGLDDELTRPLRRASAAAARGDAPLVLDSGAEGVELEWPEERANAPRALRYPSRSVVVAPWRSEIRAAGSAVP